MTEAEKTAEDMIAEFRTITERMFNIINKSDIAIKSAIKECDRIISELHNLTHFVIDGMNVLSDKIDLYKEVKQILESKL